MVGNTQLPRGDYTLKVEGSDAVITNWDNNQSVTTPVKIENVDKKFDMTAVEAIKKGDGLHATEIQLGGSNTKLEFN
jgi:hypothetical protein